MAKLILISRWILVIGFYQPLLFLFLEVGFTNSHENRFVEHEYLKKKTIWKNILKLFQVYWVN